jgi:hypothetical protein
VHFYDFVNLLALWALVQSSHKNDSIVSSLQCKTNSFGIKYLQTNLFTTVDGEELSNGKVRPVLAK